MVLSFFDSCCFVGYGCGQENENHLDRLLQRATGKIASRKVTDTSTDPANTEVAIPTMPQRIPQVHTDL